MSAAMDQCYGEDKKREEPRLDFSHLRFEPLANARVELSRPVFVQKRKSSSGVSNFEQSTLYLLFHFSTARPTREEPLLLRINRIGPSEDGLLPRSVLLAPTCIFLSTNPMALTVFVAY